MRLQHSAGRPNISRTHFQEMPQAVILCSAGNRTVEALCNSSPDVHGAAAGRTAGKVMFASGSQGILWEDQ